MDKIVSKDIKILTPPRLDPVAPMNVLLRKVRRTMAVTLATIAGGYFVALCIMVVILIMPIFLVRKLENRLSAER